MCNIITKKETKHADNKDPWEYPAGFAAAKPAAAAIINRKGKRKGLFSGIINLYISVLFMRRKTYA